MESSAHCPSLHLIHQHYPTVAGLFTTNTPVYLLQHLRKPEAPKTSQADGETQALSWELCPPQESRAKLARSEMIPTRLCTKSCPDTVCSLLQMRRDPPATPPARTQALCGCCPPCRAHTGERSWLEGAKAGRHRDKCRVVEGRRAWHFSRQVLPHPWPHCRWKENACVWEVGGALPRPQFSWTQRLVRSHRGFSSCCKDTSPLRPSIACPGSEGAAVSQPTETADCQHLRDQQPTRSTGSAWPSHLRTAASSPMRGCWFCRCSP